MSTPVSEPERRAHRARGLARQATEIVQRKRRELEQALHDERVACNEALIAEAAALGVIK